MRVTICCWSGSRRSCAVTSSAENVSIMYARRCERGCSLPPPPPPPPPSPPPLFTVLLPVDRLSPCELSEPSELTEPVLSLDALLSPLLAGVAGDLLGSRSLFTPPCEEEDDDDAEEEEVTPNCFKLFKLKPRPKFEPEFEPSFKREEEEEEGAGDTLPSTPDTGATGLVKALCRPLSALDGGGDTERFPVKLLPNSPCTIRPAVTEGEGAAESAALMLDRVVAPFAPA